MARVKLFIGALFLVIFLVLSINAQEQDYSGVKGDFKIFLLGDSPDIVKAKIDYLVAKNAVVARYAPHSCVLTVFGEEMYCGFEFFHDQLQKIALSSWNMHPINDLDGDLEDLILNRIKPSFVEIYGKPTNDYGYPTIFDLREGYVTFVAQWKLPRKTITLGVMQYKFELGAVIWITDNALTKAKQDEEAAKKQAENQSSKNDF